MISDGISTLINECMRPASVRCCWRMDITPLTSTASRQARTRPELVATGVIPRLPTPVPEPTSTTDNMITQNITRKSVKLPYLDLHGDKFIAPATHLWRPGNDQLWPHIEAKSSTDWQKTVTPDNIDGTYSCAIFGANLSMKASVEMGEIYWKFYLFISSFLRNMCSNNVKSCRSQKVILLSSTLTMWWWAVTPYDFTCNHYHV